MKKRKERIDRGIKVRSGDIFALCSWREMAYLASPRLITIIGCLVLPFFLSVYWQKVLLSVAVFALLAIYGSLVPLRFEALSFVEAIERFRAIPFLSLSVQHRADWVANILLFVPIGFFSMAV